MAVKKSDAVPKAGIAPVVLNRYRYFGTETPGNWVPVPVPVPNIPVMIRNRYGTAIFVYQPVKTGPDYLPVMRQEFNEHFRHHC
ncbi:hypothetical protein HanHA300_Chr06g0215301 [Helianthus annuus]|nr:hypothetical protein HanHA300_Chr06g0215301 [Helianthus annuus]KAJ0573824.1 hypothetical protein HanHA89_Chr06g0231071 [Helianthus annuus]KAJ0738159.1 hypothetical protein HanLR1_Chr06g0215001 [Helianthus annuus]KAJ0741056.1 hypothetical protein HanOQP8_Chr06g0223631 [Helianthus annuus]